MTYMYFEPIFPQPKLEEKDQKVVSAIGLKSSLRAVSKTLHLSVTPTWRKLKELENKQIVRCVRSWSS